MKLIDLPDYAKKYKTKGYDVKKINNEFYLTKLTIRELMINLIQLLL